MNRTELKEALAAEIEKVSQQKASGLRIYGPDDYEKAAMAAMVVAFERGQRSPLPIPMRLHCPICHALHIDEFEFATMPHHTHACQKCGEVWRPSVHPTVGVRFLPGFKNP